ncbi:MAG: FG-GAP repeat protein [Planctomycetes bacterium]|nr:FG-GAP repeat protein [Planctomycetota bacterium]
MNHLSTLMLVAAVAGPSLAAADYSFAQPRMLNGGDKPIEVEAPGYAAPSVADLNGDGVPDLLVGQFRDGKIGFYKGSRGKDGKLTFGAHEWLQAGGEVAKIPGVW